MSEYFKSTKQEHWSLKDAFNSYIKDLQHFTMEQKLSKFHAFLKDQKDPNINNLLERWKRFYQHTSKEDNKGKENQSQQQVNISHSSNHNFTFTGSVSYNTRKSLETIVSNEEHEEKSIKKRGPEEENSFNSKKALHKSRSNDSVKSTPSVGEKIWSIWEEFLHESSFDDTLFIYSPLRYGVITCGEGIPPQRNMPKENYYKLLQELEKKNTDGVSLPYHECIDSVIDSETLEGMLLAARKLLDTGQALQKSPDHSPKILSFLQDIFLLFSRGVYDPRTKLTHSESMYNTMLIFPTLEAVMIASNNNDMTFVPGEEPLNSMTLYLRSTVPLYDDRHCYKADGIIKYSVEPSFEAEMLLLETSNAYGIADSTKRGFDHHKSMFGLLSMLKNVADEYSYCSFKTFSTLELYFLHVYRDKMRLWSLSSPSKGVYVLNKKWSITVPFHFEKKDPELLIYSNKFWDLKTKLEQAAHAVNAIKQEHKKTLKEFRYRYGEYPSEQLLSRIVDPVITKITENQDSKGMGREFPRSSLAHSSPYTV